MKKLLTIFISVFICSCSKSQFFYHLIHNGVTSNVTSSVKNIRTVETTGYEAFGFLVQNKVNQATYYHTMATTHTTGAYPIYRTLNITAQVLSDPITITPVDSLYTAVTSGGQMDNDSSVIFIVKNHTDIYHSRDIYIQKVDSNNHFSAPVLFNWTGITQLQGGFFFGPLIQGDNAGESYAIMYQLNGDTGSTRRRITCIKTTDYWNTYSEQGVLYDVSGSPVQYSETAGCNLGNGKFTCVTRLDNSGICHVFESTDHGATWIRRGTSSLYSFNGGSPNIPWMLYHDGVFDIPFENRDASMILISKNNTVAANFGNATPVYNDNEIYAFNLGGGTNPSLGYISDIKLSNGYFLLIYSKEISQAVAKLQWTIDDLITDPAGIPISPTLASSSVTTTSFRVDVTNYSEINWQNVRYFLMDLSTDPLFGSFVTAKYRTTSFPAVVMHNVRWTSYNDTYNSLTTGTTYYLRFTPCNNAGCGTPTVINVTTQ